MSNKLFSEFDDTEAERVLQIEQTKKKHYPEDEKTVEQLLLDIFGGNNYHAVAGEHERDIYYTPVEKKLTVRLLTKHLKGETILGSYQLQQKSNLVRWIAWDIDCKTRKTAREYATKIIKYLSHLPYVVEFSGSKGYHVFIFLRNPMQASKAKLLAEKIRDAEEIPSSGPNHVECFPKQDKLTSDRPKGSLLKIPLGDHPRSHEKSVFVDIANGWESGPEVNPFEVLRYRAKAKDVEAIVAESAVDPLDTLIEVMSPFWVDGARHDLSLYLCGFLANEGWTQEQTTSLVERICDRTGDGEIKNRLQTIKTTYERFGKGKRIRGRQGLSELLPSASMQRLTELVSIMKAPDTVRQVDEIRFTKGRAPIESSRLASETIWGILNDGDSMILKVSTQEIYWYDAETHQVMDCRHALWEAMLNKLFGLNSADRFSKLVLRELNYKLIDRAVEMPVYRTAHWDVETKKLYINLGSPEVYIVSGQGEIEVSYNGFCGVFFKTEIGSHVEPNLDKPSGATFTHLINDLSFTTSGDCPATPEQQRELMKAWMLSYFFSELLPTRPILSVIGAPGSGKTTAMRRFVRIFENIEGDVLGIPTDKLDAFRVSISHHRLLVLDNLERSGAWWMVDMLNKLSTGANIELRRLFSTDDQYTIKPDCFVAVTAVKIPFSDETLFSRLLVLELQKLDEPIPEYIMQRTLKDNASAIWGDLLYLLGDVVEALRNVETPLRAPTSSRLADFSVFCDRIKRCDVIDAELLQDGLLSMTNLQMHQLSQSSPAVVLLAEWLNADPITAAKWMDFQQLHVTLLSSAQSRKLTFPWKNAMSLFRHFTAVQSLLEQEFKYELKTSNGQFDPHTAFNVGDLKVRFNAHILSE